MRWRSWSRRRARLAAQLAHHRAIDACPFPLDQACAPGEDAFHSRSGDVPRQDRKLKHQAPREMPRHHGAQDGRERRRQVESGEA